MAMKWRCSEVIKLFACSNQLNMKFSLLIIYENFHIYLRRIFQAQLYLAKQVAIVSDLRYISRTNFMLSWDEHEKSFISSSLFLIQTCYNLYLFIQPHHAKVYLTACTPSEASAYAAHPRSLNSFSMGNQVSTASSCELWSNNANSQIFSREAVVSLSVLTRVVSSESISMSVK